MSDQSFIFNGLDAETGEYLTPPLPPATVVALARGRRPDAAQMTELRHRAQQSDSSFDPRAGVDPRRLEEAGWGVVFAANADPAIRAALSPLLDLRRQQAGARNPGLFREFAGEDGFRPGETKSAFLARHGAGPGLVDPEKVPYYLLLVGDAVAIPYNVQSQLDIAYAVGRLSFDGATPDEVVQKYANYARSVVRAETGELLRTRRATFFATRNPDDRSSQSSADNLAQPLTERLAKTCTDWTVESVIGVGATKPRLGQILCGDEPPALVFTASHGASFKNGSPFQAARQGSLVCQEWPGPKQWNGKMDDTQLFMAEDVSAGARGLVAFLYACHSAGTPKFDAYPEVRAGATERVQVAPRSLVGSLPQALLAHPDGGALAVAGHIDRAWSWSYAWTGAGVQLVTFESTLSALLQGDPIGMAFEAFNKRYSELAVMLTSMLEDAKYGGTVDETELAYLWTATNDARGWVILGDPAVRIPVKPA